MFEKQKAEVIAEQIRKYAGQAVKVSVEYCQTKDKYTVNIEALEDNFSLEVKGIEIKIKGKRNGDS